MERADHLRALRVFHAVYGAIVLVAAFFAPSVQRGLGWWAAPGGWGISLVAVLAMLAFLHLAASVGLPRPWGRSVSIVAAVPSLPSIPFGTALGAYALYVHLRRSHEVPG